MDTVFTRLLKSTIGRTGQRSTPALKVQSRGRVARCRPSCRRVTAVLSWIHDPLGIATDLEGWTLDEEVRADLEYGRD